MKTKINDGLTEPPSQPRENYQINTVHSLLMAGLKVDHVNPMHKKYPYPVLFVHGMWGGSWVFHYLMLFLARLGYECYALNLRGHHGSKQGTTVVRATLGDYEKDVLDVIGAIGHPVALIGWSMGSLIGARIARSCPKVKAYVGLASAPPRGVALMFRVLIRMPRYFLKMVLGLPVMLTPAHCRYMMFNTSSDAEFKEMNERLVPESGWAALFVSLWVYGIRRTRCPSALISFADDNIVGGQRKIAVKMGVRHYWKLPGSHTAFVTERHGKEVGECIHLFLQECLKKEVDAHLRRSII